MKVEVITKEGKSLANGDAASVCFFNSNTFGDAIELAEKNGGNYEPGQEVVFVSVDNVACVTVRDAPDD